MNRNARSVVFAGFVVLACSLLVRAEAGEMAPLGFVLGRATQAEVKNLVPPDANLRDIGTNSYSGGPMLKSDGAGSGIDALRWVTYIFDKNELLVAVSMKMDKHRFEQVYGVLKEKYPVIQQSIPFVGNKRVKLGYDDVFVEIDAPHLSFEMGVNYMTQNFYQKYAQALEAKRLEKHHHEKNQF